MSDKPVTIIIPTFNNLDYLIPCVESIAANTVEYCRFLIVNNGAKELENYIKGLNIIHTGRNLGWMGGINEGLKHVDENSEYVILMNDDTHILPHHYDWIEKMKVVFDNDPTVGAVGPSSNVVAGWQNIRHYNGLPAVFEVKYLIGFCVMMRKKVLEEMGGLDESLPGGDDLDWSIKLRKMGYKLIARRDSFVYHHGFVTGNKIHGDHAQVGGWNSPQMTETTNMAIIRKHGFKAFWETMKNEPLVYDTIAEEYGEDGCLMKIVQGKGLDIGCGQSKIHPDATGVDLVTNGEVIWEFEGKKHVSEADIKASGDNLPFGEEVYDYVVARHNLEHYSNPVRALREWHRVLKPGGMIGITTPDDARLNNMRLDRTHKHSFNRECVKDLLEMTGFELTEMGGCSNQWDFYAIGKKVAHA